MAKDKTQHKKRKYVLLTKEQILEAKKSVEARYLTKPEIYDLPKSERTIEELTDYFIHIEEGSNRILPKEKRRYVIYLRKSTDDEAKQIRSLEDQRTECLSLANDILKIKVREEDIFEETASAKTSGKREIFDNMLQGFRSGKYHGLIAWSPDRLSRNMKEAGEIIEMIDTELIQDLHFKTYQFDNTPNGKMLLGILFATSKQYSDKLSVDVARGNTGKIKEGRYNGAIKKGYYSDKSTGYFMPDDYNWNLLREAVYMRLHQKKTNPEIVEFLINSHFSERSNQDTNYRLVKINEDGLKKIWKDPFYFGLYKYGKNKANLMDLYSFIPLITPDEYIQLNKDTAKDFGKKAVARNSGDKRLGYGLLRNKIICDFCDQTMQFQHQQIHRGINKGKWLISYYCRNKNCIRHDEKQAIEKYGHKLQKSVRGLIVLSYIEATLRNCTKKSNKAYQLYINRLEQKLAQDKAIARRKLNDAKNDLRNNERQYAKYQNFQIDHPKEYEKHHKGKLEQYSNLISVAQHNIEDNQKKLELLNKSLPTQQEFYDIFLEINIQPYTKLGNYFLGVVTLTSAP